MKTLIIMYFNDDDDIQSDSPSKLNNSLYFYLYICVYSQSHFWNCKIYIMTLYSITLIIPFEEFHEAKQTVLSNENQTFYSTLNDAFKMYDLLKSRYMVCTKDSSP